MKRNYKRIAALITLATVTSSLFVGNTTVSGARSYSKEDLINQFKQEVAKNNIAKQKEANDKKIQELTKGEVNDNGPSRNADQNEVVRIIVQLNEDAAVKETKAEDKVLKDQKDIISKVENITGTNVKRSFGYLINGFSINAKRGDIQKIKAISGVKTVTESVVYYPDMEYAKGITKATEVWKNQGYKGEGMVVSIIDTGIDYTHKDLSKIDTSKAKLDQAAVNGKLGEVKGGKYLTDKVPFGYNYADGNDDVIDKGSQHGQHVAGIVAANGDVTTNPYEAIKGVAPEAQLLAMKVFSNNLALKGAFDDDIIAAIEDSVKLGADVINMSLGSSAGFMNSEDPQQVAIQNATDAGVICVISAGNSQVSDSTNGNTYANSALGLKDNAMVGSPGTTKGALTVASMENTNVATTTLTVKSEAGYVKEVAFTAVDGSDYETLKTYKEYVYCGIGQPSDVEKLDLTGKIAVIDRGTIAFTEKYKNALNKGAEGVIIVNTSENNINMAVEADITKPILMIGKSAGAEIKAKIKAGENKFALFNEGKIGPTVNSLSGFISNFTSWGPTPNLELKPEVIAPGGRIYSLANGNSYQDMSGTSMSSPHTAGGQALIMQSLKAKGVKATGKELVELAKNIAMNTADPMTFPATGVKYSPRAQGAGLLQLDKAVKNNVTITDSKGKAALTLKNVGETTEFELKIKNYGNEEVTYTLDDAEVLSQTYYNGLMMDAPVDNSKVTFSNKTVTIAPNGEATVKGTLIVSKADMEANFETNNYVEGFISFKSSKADIPSLSVPFLGFYGDFGALPIIDEVPVKGSNSFIGMTSLGEVSEGGFDSYGLYQEGENTYIDHNLAAFSPNGDKIRENVGFQAYMLRNAKNLTVEITDSKGNVVRTPYTENSVRRNNLVDFLANGVVKTSSVWDGTIYNSKTGKYDVAPDGQYTVRLLSVSDLEGSKKQVIEMPVKLDTKNPVVKDINLNKTGSDLVLSWKATEELSGLVNMVGIFINGQMNIVDINDLTVNGDNYSTVIPDINGELTDVFVVMLDNAGNAGVAETVIDGEVASAPVAFTNLEDSMVLGSNYVAKGKYKILGYMNSNISKIVINGVEANLIGQRFMVELPVVEGNNSIEVKAYEGSTEVYSNGYNIVVDTKAPTLKTTPSSALTPPFYTTDKDNIDIAVEASDNSAVQCILVDLISGEMKQVDLSEGKGSINVKLTLGLNGYIIAAIDEAGNTTTSTVIVSRVKSMEKFELTVGLEPLTILGASSLKNGMLPVEGFMNIKPKVLKINDKDVNVNSDLTFKEELKLNEGLNLIRVYAEDEEGNVVYNHAYKVLYDSKAPEVKFDGLKAAHSDDKIYVNNENFELKGTVTDNLYGYTFSINGEALAFVDKFPSENPEELKSTFDKKYTLTDGENHFNISITDQFGNTKNEDLKVVLDKEAPAKPVINLSTNEWTNKPVKVSLDYDKDDAAIIEYSFDNKTFYPYTGEFEVQVSSTIFARATDLAGNVSEADVVSPLIDITAPVITVDGVQNNGKYFDAVEPKISVDDKEAVIIATLNGKEYKGEKITEVGTYELVVYATDKVGNKSKESKISFSIEKKAGDNTTGNGVTGGTTSNGSSGTGNSAQTGSSNVGTMMATMMMAISGGALIFLRRRKEKKNN